MYLKDIDSERERDREQALPPLIYSPIVWLDQDEARN